VLVGEALMRSSDPARMISSLRGCDQLTPLVKICGIRNSTTALHTIRCGADFIGLVFAESPRKVAYFVFFVNFCFEFLIKPIDASIDLIQVSIELAKEVISTIRKSNACGHNLLAGLLIALIFIFYFLSIVWICH
jgi:hypothetical protein